MKTVMTALALLFAFNIAATAHAEDGSTRYREMVEDLREQNQERSEAKQRQNAQASQEKSDPTKNSK